MPDDLAHLLLQRRPTPQRPLMGLTILAVEDSRFASEALRLLCHHSGARLRRADSLAHARRHLLVYRPTVVIVDMGLPDGSGAELIAELHNASPRVPVILAISGTPETRDSALAAGAQAFFDKPMGSLAAFQTAILRELPEDMRPTGPRSLTEAELSPDFLALRDDLSQLADLIDTSITAEQMRYAAQFLTSLACSAEDPDLAAAANQLEAAAEHDTEQAQDELKPVSRAIRDRLSDSSSWAIV